MSTPAVAEVGRTEATVNPALTSDLCLKCNICTAMCPVASVTDAFPGPKTVGPQAQRFRHPRVSPPEHSVAWCSGCGVCSRVCPHGVAVAEINLLAKADRRANEGIPLRDRIISRPDLLGKLFFPVAPWVNLILGLGFTRQLLGRSLGIHPKAPLPRFARIPLDRQLRMPTPPFNDGGPSEDGLEVVYFSGCSTNYYEPDLGKQTIRLLERLGCRVHFPRQVCCGMPLLSNGFVDEACELAERAVQSLAPFAARGVPIIGSSPSCIYMLKNHYRLILGLDDEEAATIAAESYDIFEYILRYRFDFLKSLRLAPQPARVLYHPPCHLRAHGIGTPAVQVLRLIPDLELYLSDSECCGVAGTYALKRERYEVACAVGGALFQQARDLEVDFAISDTETCCWWIEKHTGIRAYHPIQILTRSLGDQT